jgi:hypothetical protein
MVPDERLVGDHLHAVDDDDVPLAPDDSPAEALRDAAHRRERRGVGAAVEDDREREFEVVDRVGILDEAFHAAPVDPVEVDLTEAR